MINLRPYTNDKYILIEVKQDYFDIEYTKEDIVLDLGAHIGIYTCLVSDKVKQVYSFEPERDNFRMLKNNTNELVNVKIYNKAVTNKTGKTLLYIDNCYNTGGHMTVVDDKSKFSTQEVNTVGLQKLLDKYKPTILKCDIEGSEYNFFDIVFNKELRYLIIEIHYCIHLNLYNVEFHLLLKYLAKYFKMVKEKDRLEDSEGQLVACTYILPRLL